MLKSQLIIIWSVGMIFLNRDAQEQSLRSPITSIISGTTELKAAPSWGPLFCDLLSNFFLLEYESLWR